MIVRLKVVNKSEDGAKTLRFNSMIVRLKDAQVTIEKGGRVEQFQFYDSPIKSTLVVGGNEIKSAFQFYDSPIKRPPRRIDANSVVRFNSMIVRLKVGIVAETFPKLKIVSIL